MCTATKQNVSGKLEEQTDQQTQGVGTRKNTNLDKWRSDDLGIGGLRHSGIASPSSAMPILARAILPNMIVLYVFQAIEETRGSGDHSLSCVRRHMLNRRWNGQHA